MWHNVLMFLLATTLSFAPQSYSRPEVDRWFQARVSVSSRFVRVPSSLPGTPTPPGNPTTSAFGEVDAWYRQALPPEPSPLPTTTANPSPYRAETAGSTETAALPTLSTAESQFLDLVNALRKTAGAPPLRVNPVLTTIARQRVAEIQASGLFQHDLPGLGLPLTEELAMHYQALAMGAENLAEAADVNRAFIDLASEPLHRENLLNPVFTETGIAIAPIPGGIVVDQLFSGPLE